MKRIVLLVIAITFTACERPGDHVISSKCNWIEAEDRQLNLAKSADRRHLRYDSETAEDVAIRWADKYYGHLPEYEARRNVCMETLFAGVAKQHGVDIALVREYSLQRNIVVDSAVVIAFGILYFIAAYIFAGRIRRRFALEEPGFWVLTVTMAIGISLVGVMIGILGSIVIESIRLNSGHLSYRMNRIPFRQHWAALFVCGIVIYALAVLLHTRAKPGSHKQAQTLGV